MQLAQSLFCYRSACWLAKLLTSILHEAKLFLMQIPVWQCALFHHTGCLTLQEDDAKAVCSFLFQWASNTHARLCGSQRHSNATTNIKQHTCTSQLGTRFKSQWACELLLGRLGCQMEVSAHVVTQSVCWYREEPAISPRVLAQWPQTGFGPVDNLPGSPLTKATQAYQSGKIPKRLGMQVGYTLLLTRGALCIAVHILTGQACSASC